jgi:hypothetical protein
MADEEPTQKTQPKKGEPIEIPVPDREAILDALRKVAKPQPRAKDQRRRPDR